MLNLAQKVGEKKIKNEQYKKLGKLLDWENTLFANNLQNVFILIFLFF